jgi:hypothetical protein
MRQPATLAPEGRIPAHLVRCRTVPLLLPQPQDVSGAVVIAVEGEAALRAVMPPSRQPFPDHRATARAPLAGKRRVDRNDSLPGTRSLEGEDGEELPPAGIRDALGESMVLHHVADPQIFVIDDIVLARQRAGFFVLEVPPLPPHVLMRLGEQLDRLSAALTALLPPGDAALRLGEPLLRRAVVPRVRNTCAIGARRRPPPRPGLCRFPGR